MTERGSRYAAESRGNNTWSVTQGYLHDLLIDSAFMPDLQSGKWYREFGQHLRQRDLRPRQQEVERSHMLNAIDVSSDTGRDFQ